MMNGGSINRAFNKDCVVDNKSSSLQFCMRDKSWTSTCNVHIRLWFPEGTAHGIWLEGIDDIPSSCLVDELEGDLVCEWPLEDVVKLSTHHHKEQ